MPEGLGLRIESLKDSGKLTKSEKPKLGGRGRDYLGKCILLFGRKNDIAEQENAMLVGRWGQI